MKLSIDNEEVKKLYISKFTKLSHFFSKKLQKSVTIWEHLPKGYSFWIFFCFLVPGLICGGESENFGLRLFF